MGDKKRGKRSRKRKFVKNQHTKQTVDLDLDLDPPDESSNLPPNVDSNDMPSSAKKLKSSATLSYENKELTNNNPFILMNMGCLSEFLSQFMRCPECCEFSVSALINDQMKQGFCHTVFVRCSNCSWTTTFDSTKSVQSQAKSDKQPKKEVKEINVRMVSFVRSLGRGHSALDKFCLYTGSPTPMTKMSYRYIFHLVSQSMKAVEEESMSKAAEEELADPSLLSKCLHGKTQNCNENLNKLIWDRCSKEHFVDRYTIEEAVNSAVSHFNDGKSSVIKLFEIMGVPINSYMIALCQASDTQRIINATIKSSEKAKKRRKTLRAIRKGFQDTLQEKEGDLYTPGGH